MPNYQIAQPLEIDHMPAEVATEMLARGKLTNRQRKQCMQARQRVFGGDVPLRSAALMELGVSSELKRRFRRGVLRDFRAAGDTPPNGFVFDAEFQLSLPEEKLARKHAVIPIDRLGRMVTRSIRARRRVQTAYAKLAGDESKQAVKLRRLLDLAAAHHEAIQDSAQETINARMKKCQS